MTSSPQSSSPVSAYANGILEAVTDELLAHGEFSSGANNRSNAREAARVVIDMVRTYDYAQTPAEPHETTYLRGWNECLERCAEIAESSAVTRNGTKIGIGIATKIREQIRALADTSTDRAPGAYLADGTKINPRALHPFYDHPEEGAPSDSSPERGDK